MKLANIRKLEGLLASVKDAKQRKRKGLTLHADELPAVEAALVEALDEASHTNY